MAIEFASLGTEVFRSWFLQDSREQGEFSPFVKERNNAHN